MIGIEACAGPIYWGRELARLGHDARLMAAQFVTPYRKSGKNDANDAEAICEAVGRPNMRYVPIKSEEAQAILTVHRARTLLVSERTALSDQVRGLLGEFGLVFSQGMSTLKKMLIRIGGGDFALPMWRGKRWLTCTTRLRSLDISIALYDRRIAQLARQSESAQRLMQIAGVGPITATAMVASVGMPCVCQCPSVRGLAGANASAIFERRQDEAWGHHQARRGPSADIAHSRYPLGPAAGTGY